MENNSHSDAGRGRQGRGGGGRGGRGRGFYRAGPGRHHDDDDKLNRNQEHPKRNTQAQGNLSEKPTYEGGKFASNKAKFADRKQSDRNQRDKTGNEIPIENPAVPSIFADSQPATTKTNETKKANNVGTVANNPAKKLRKIIIRKLPASKNYTFENFSQHFSSLLQRLSLPDSMFRIDHFTSGKLSRKRGPIFSTGYVTVFEEEFYDKFLRQVPSKIPFMEDESDGQPEVGAAPYPKSFRFKEKVDKYANTYEEDPEFLAFKQRLENPAPQKEASLASGPSTTAATTAPTMTLEEKLKNNSLLNFLREKAQKKFYVKVAKKEKKLLKEQLKKEKAKEKKKKKRKEKKLLMLEESKKRTAVATGGIDDVNSFAGSAGKKKRDRKKKEKSKDVEVESASPVPKKKITILKKEKPVVATPVSADNASTATTLTASTADQVSGPSLAPPGPPTGKLSRKEKSRLKREQPFYPKPDDSLPLPPHLPGTELSPYAEEFRGFPSPGYLNPPVAAVAEDYFHYSGPGDNTDPYRDRERVGDGGRRGGGGYYRGGGRGGRGRSFGDEGGGGRRWKQGRGGGGGYHP